MTNEACARALEPVLCNKRSHHKEKQLAKA